MGKIATTWQLMKDAWGVLMRDKELLLFPVASGLATFLVLLTFILPFVGAALWGPRGTSNGAFYVVLFFYYVCNFFVIVYFNAALVAHVVTRLRGGEPTLGRSLGQATACIPQIAAWALISATVGVILRWLSERAGFLGHIAIALVGFALIMLNVALDEYTNPRLRPRKTAPAPKPEPKPNPFVLSPSTSPFVLSIAIAKSKDRLRSGQAAR